MGMKPLLKLLQDLSPPRVGLGKQGIAPLSVFKT